jgi:hypothetical protein
MGRQTRQARRAQERRAQARGRQSAQGPDRKWLLAGVAVVLAAVALLAYFYATNGGSGSAETATPTAVPAAAIDGVGCNPGGEVVTYHQHAHLALYEKGKHIAVPALIGFDVNHDCLFWLHTHQGEEGVIHMEAPSKIEPKLSTFFKIWREPLNSQQIGTIKVTSGEQVKTFLNGQPYAGDPANIPLVRHEQIVIEVGPPFVKPPSFTFGTL